MDLGLKDSVVLVTGSSSGIGRAAALAFAREGAQVAITWHSDRPGAEETAAGVRAAGGRALVLNYRLEDPTSIRAALAAVGKEWGCLNVLVNNAVLQDRPAPSGQLFEDVPSEVWQSMLRSSLEGVALTVQCALPLMRKAGWGRIVSISSDAVDGWPGLGPYATAKAGLHGLSRTLAVERGAADILSNVVMPGFVLTERNEKRVPQQYQEQVRQSLFTHRLVTPADVAAVVVFLSSQLNRQVTGQVVRVDGGRR